MTLPLFMLIVYVKVVPW